MCFGAIAFSKSTAWAVVAACGHNLLPQAKQLAKTAGITAPQLQVGYATDIQLVQAIKPERGRMPYSFITIGCLLGQC